MSKIREGLDQVAGQKIQNIIRQNPKGSASEKILLGKFLGSDQGSYARNVLGKNHKEWIEHITSWLKKNQPRLQQEFDDVDFSDLESLAYDMYENYLAKQGQLEGYSAGAVGGAGLGEAYPKQQMSLYKPDGSTYRGKSMPKLEKDPVDKARRLSKNIPADLPDPDEDIRQKQLKKTINDLINSELIDREQKVLRAYYFDEKTLEQIAKQFDVHPTRISQILAKAERKLRHPARSSLLRPFVRPELGEEQAPMFTPEAKMVNANDPMSDGWRLYKLKNEQQLDEKCWDTHKQVGMKKKSGKMVPNCVPKESAIMKGIQAENESSKRK